MKIGEYCGFDLIAPGICIENKGYIYLQKNARYQIEIGTSDIGILIRINNFLDSFGDYIKDLKKELKEKQDYIVLSK